MSPGHSFLFAQSHCCSDSQLSNMKLAPDGLSFHDLGPDRYQRTPPFAYALSHIQSRAQWFQYNPLGPGICPLDLEHTFYPWTSLHESHMAQRGRHHGLSTLQSPCYIHHHRLVSHHDISPLHIPVVPSFVGANSLLLPRVSTALSLVLDIRTRHLSYQHGSYNSMQDVKIAFSTASQHAAVSPYPEHDSGRSLSHETSRPYRVQRPIEAQQFGYTMPSEQTTYDSPSGSHWL